MIVFCDSREPGRLSRILPEHGIAEIPLTQGQVAIIDISDAERVLAHTWCARKGRHRAALAQR